MKKWLRKILIMNTIKKLESSINLKGLELSENDISSIHILLIKLAECEHQYYLNTKKSNIGCKVRYIGNPNKIECFENKIKDAA